MKKWILRLSVLAFILGIGIYFTVSMPATVESAVPKITTVKINQISHKDIVTAKGEITKNEDKWLVVVAAGEADIKRLKPGQISKLQGVAFDEGTYAAKVIYIADTARKQSTGYATQTVVDVTLEVTNPDENLRSGYTATAKIETSATKKINTIPYNSILQDQNGEYVLVYKDGEAVRKDIVTGSELSGGTEVVSGLSLDDEIILNPNEKIENSVVIRTESDE